MLCLAVRIGLSILTNGPLACRVVPLNQTHSTSMPQAQDSLCQGYREAIILWISEIIKGIGWIHRRSVESLKARRSYAPQNSGLARVLPSEQATTIGGKTLENDI